MTGQFSALKINRLIWHLFQKMFEIWPVFFGQKLLKICQKRFFRDRKATVVGWLKWSEKWYQCFESWWIMFNHKNMNHKTPFFENWKNMAKIVKKKKVDEPVCRTKKMWKLSTSDRELFFGEEFLKTPNWAANQEKQLGRKRSFWHFFCYACFE